jgi:hypothetical protein
MTRKYNSKTRFRDDEYNTTLKRKGKKTISIKEKERLRMWAAHEIKTLLQPDFKVIKVYGDYDINVKFNPMNSERKIIVAKKVKA